MFPAMNCFYNLRSELPFPPLSLYSDNYRDLDGYVQVLHYSNSPFYHPCVILNYVQHAKNKKKAETLAHLGKTSLG